MEVSRLKDEAGKRQFFITPEHACSYLPDRQANTLFLDPRETTTPALYQTLSENGFRRSGSHLYRPHCAGCRACVPSRIPVAAFVPRRRHRRVLRRNADLRLRIEPGVFSRASYELYARYIEARHRDGDMYPPSADQYRSFLLSPWSRTRFLCTYLDSELIAVAVTDVLPDGLSAIYTYFDPELDRRSLGVFSILAQIDYCRSLDLSYLYLGYWVKDAEKMTYKTEYRPVELFLGGRWVALR